MNRVTKRLAFVPAVTLLFSSFLTSTPAHASSCYVGTPFVGVAAGASTSGEDAVWTTETTGETTLEITSADGTQITGVYTETCVHLWECWYVTSCTVTHTGTLSITVGGGFGPYVLTATPNTLPGIEPPPAGTCNIVNTGGVCVNVATGSLVERVYAYGVETGTSGTHRVVGAIDRYSFALPTGGSLLVPCVVLAVNSLGNDGCELAGGTFVDRFATLVDQSVPQPSAGLGEPIASVGICNARVTATVAGFGAENLPAFTVC